MEDLIFKSMDGLDGIDREKLFPLVERIRSRRHRLEVIGKTTNVFKSGCGREPVPKFLIFLFFLVVEAMKLGISLGL